MTTLEVLVKARARLAEPGVWVNRGPEADTEACVVTAIADASRQLDCEAEYKDAAWSAVGHAISGEYMYLGAWNDAPGRTLDEVLAAFDKAIAAEAERP